MRTAKPTIAECISELKTSEDIIKSLNEKLERQQIRLDAIDLMSCFMFAKVPEAPNGVNGFWKNNRRQSLVSQYERYLAEKEYNKNLKQVREASKPKKVK